MAYLDLDVAAAGFASVRDVAGAASPAPLLGPAERSVILFSVEETRGGRLARAARRLAGGPAVFAAKRLEALRRYAIRYRIEGEGLPLEEDGRLRAAGFSDLQAAAIRALVEQASFAPAERPHRARAATLLSGLALALIPASVGTILYRWLAAIAEDRASALFVAVMLVTGFVLPITLAGHPASRRH